jgi:NAD(P)-dependent dehydrogenase (short-subunit alcohol dehydrogenase family)
VIGAGSIGQAIARRVSAGKHVVLADLHQRESVHALVETATALGDVTGVIHAAGVSPSQASPATILAADLYGTALVLEEFGNVIAPGGAGVVIASQSGLRLGALTAEQNTALATTPAGAAAPQTKSEPSARCSWAPTERSSPAATSSWTSSPPENRPDPPTRSSRSVVASTSALTRHPPRAAAKRDRPLLYL